MTTRDPNTKGEAITHDQAAEAVDAMDDCAKMDVSVDPFGPRLALERYIAQQRDLAEHDAQLATAPVQAACRCLECGAEAGEPCAEECTHPPAPAADNNPAALDGAGELLRMVATNIRSNLYSLPSIASDWADKIDAALASQEAQIAALQAQQPGAQAVDPETVDPVVSEEC